MGTLVIVDMQLCFSASYHTLPLQTCLEEIKQAKKRKGGIIALCHHSGGPIQPLLYRELRSYPRFEKVIKYDDDGGREVYDTLIGFGLDYKTLKICGINGDVCVRKTVETLSSLLPYSRIHIVKEGVGAPWKIEWDWVYKLKNVKLLKKESFAE